MGQIPLHYGPEVVLKVGRGPRSTERLLLDEIERSLEDLGAAALQHPLLLVVPSRSLRLHLLDRLLTHRGRAVAGVDCRTHHSLAATILADAGSSSDMATELFPIFARRLAQRQPALREALGLLRDGYGATFSAVRDLLDAGLDPAHEEALLESLQAEGRDVASAEEIRRAEALIRVAAATAEEMRNYGHLRISDQLQQAALAVRTDGTSLSPSAVLLYGYADATGTVTDFLQALVQTFGGRLYLDQPPDPADPVKADAGVRFSRRFHERFQASGAGEETAQVSESGPERVEFFSAPGTVAEVREVAHRIHDTLTNGGVPERIAVVTRDPERYRAALRTQFERLAIPFSAVGLPGPHGALSRAAAGFLDLLRQRERLPTARWIELMPEAVLPAPAAELLLAFHALGAGRLGDAATVEPRRYAHRDELPLPFYRPQPIGDARGDDATNRFRRHTLSNSALSSAVNAAQRLRDLLTSWPECASPHEHRERLQRLLREELGWGDMESALGELVDAVAAALDTLPAELDLTLRELEDHLDRSLRDIGRLAFGGNGGGVQILDVMEARSRTFDHLFLMGMNRGVFPRTVREDPLLPDTLRQVLGRSGFGLLPDLPQKREGFDEEKFLFAQLLAAGRRVTISWQDVDDDQTPQALSPLVERLRWSTAPAIRDGWQDRQSAPSLYSAAMLERTTQSLVPAQDAAVLTGIFGGVDRTRFRTVLAQALKLGEGTGKRDAEQIADARLQILAELDPPHSLPLGQKTFTRLGPYLGYVGQHSTGGTGSGPTTLYITTLEGMVRCPWQTFLGSVLRIEPVPDPLAELPGLDPMLVGTVVHRVLERIADPGGEAPSSLESARRSTGARNAWPSAERLRRMTAGQAHTVAEERGIPLPAFATLLARLADDYLAAGPRTDWLAGVEPPHTVATEFEAQLEWKARDGRRHAIGFRCDRLDRNGEQLILTDYKTGRGTFGTKAKPFDKGRLPAAMRKGRWLQAATYVLAAGGPEDRGRFLLLHPDLAMADTPEVFVGADDEEIRNAFASVADTVLSAWHSGVFFPRLVEPGENREPSTCSYCTHAEACMRGDSGARGRLRRWHEGSTEDAPPTNLEKLSRELWHLPAGGDR